MEQSGMQQVAPLPLGGKGIHCWPARPDSAEIPDATGTAAAATRLRRTHAAAGTGHPAGDDCFNCEYSHRWHENILLMVETQAKCRCPTEASCVHVQRQLLLPSGPAVTEALSWASRGRRVQAGHGAVGRPLADRAPK